MWCCVRAYYIAPLRKLKKKSSRKSHLTNTNGNWGSSTSILELLKSSQFKVKKVWSQILTFLHCQVMKKAKKSRLFSKGCSKAALPNFTLKRIRKFSTFSTSISSAEIATLLEFFIVLQFDTLILSFVQSYQQGFTCSA